MNNQLSTVENLMLTQGISLIQNGLQFIEWAEETPNENSYDSLNILKDRFDLFKDDVLSESQCDHFMIDRAIDTVKNVRSGFMHTNKIQENLRELRAKVLIELRQEREKELEASKTSVD